MIDRALSNELLLSAAESPVVVLTGPRQSGKSTLTRALFPDHTYANLEQPDVRQFALDDPKGFLQQAGDFAVIDEVQRVPSLLSYIQVSVDEDSRAGRYILTGSQNFQLLDGVTQSLAGRAAIRVLLPLSVQELKNSDNLDTNYEQLLIKGSYPRIYDRKLRPTPWLQDYVSTYLERDLRTLTTVQDLTVFRQFLAICAGRIGQLINLSEIGTQVGVDYKTIKRWIGILETSYLAFRLRPYHKNYDKRILKASKLYFYDVGLASSLLNLSTEGLLINHYSRGGLFEALIITDVLKEFSNRGERPNLYFWAAAGVGEIDLIIDRPDGLIAIEIKSGRTISADCFKGLIYFAKVSGTPSSQCYVIYGGDDTQQRSSATVLSWHNMSSLYDVMWPN